MAAEPANLTLWARSGLILLCILLSASVAMRIYAYRQQSESGTVVRNDTDVPADLGDGVLLPRSAAQHRTVQVATCSTPASIYFVMVSPYGADPSLVGAPRPDDRVFYVYRGWNLGRRYATISMNAIYFARRAYYRLTTQNALTTDELAVKIIVPAGCDTSSEDVLTALRLEVRS